jgi:hypothetical protein
LVIPSADRTVNKISSSLLELGGLLLLLLLLRIWLLENKAGLEVLRKGVSTQTSVQPIPNSRDVPGRFQNKEEERI